MLIYIEWLVFCYSLGLFLPTEELIAVKQLYVYIGASGSKTSTRGKLLLEVFFYYLDLFSVLLISIFKSSFIDSKLNIRLKWYDKPWIASSEESA